MSKRLMELNVESMPIYEDKTNYELPLISDDDPYAKSHAKAIEEYYKFGKPPLQLYKSDKPCVYTKYTKKCTSKILIKGTNVCRDHAFDPKTVKAYPIILSYDYSNVDPESAMLAMMDRTPKKYVTLKNHDFCCSYTTKMGRQCKSKLLIVDIPYCLIHAKSEYDTILNYYPNIADLDLDKISPMSDTINSNMIKTGEKNDFKSDFKNSFDFFGKNCLIYDITITKKIRSSLLYNVFMQNMKDIGYPIDITNTMFTRLINEHYSNYIPQKIVHGYTYYCYIEFNQQTLYYYHRLISS